MKFDVFRADGTSVGTLELDPSAIQIITRQGERHAIDFHGGLIYTYLEPRQLADIYRLLANLADHEAKGAEDVVGNIR